MQIRIQIPKRRGRYGHLQIFWHNCSSSFFFLFFFCCKGQVFLDIQKRKVDKQFFKKGELLIQTSMSGENWEKQTNLKTSIDCIKLPNWLKTGSLPSFWIPKYSAIECKSWHFGMESRESLSHFIIGVPPQNLSSITYRTLQESSTIALHQLGHHPCSKTPAGRKATVKKKIERMKNRKHCSFRHVLLCFLFF